MSWDDGVRRRQQLGLRLGGDGRLRGAGVAARPIDIGYRYVDLGKPESGFGLDDLTSTSKIRLDNVTAHELRAGVRYMID